MSVPAMKTKQKRSPWTWDRSTIDQRVPVKRELPIVPRVQARRITLVGPGTFYIPIGSAGRHPSCNKSSSPAETFPPLARDMSTTTTPESPTQTVDDGRRTTLGLTNVNVLMVAQIVDRRMLNCVT